jgi:hypothetical protein
LQARATPKQGRRSRTVTGWHGQRRRANNGFSVRDNTRNSSSHLRITTDDINSEHRRFEGTDSLNFLKEANGRGYEIGDKHAARVVCLHRETVEALFAVFTEDRDLVEARVDLDVHLGRTLEDGLGPDKGLEVPHVGAARHLN